MKLFDSREEDTEVVEGAPIGSTDEVGAIEKTLDTVDINDPDAVQEVLADANITIEPDAEKCSKEEDDTDTDDKKDDGATVVTDPASTDATDPATPAVVTDPAAPASDADTTVPPVTDPATTDAPAATDADATADPVTPSEDVLAEKFEEDFDAAQEMLADIVKMSNIGCAIEARMALDAELLRDKKLTSEHITTSVESFILMASELGYDVKMNLESLSFESAESMLLAIEALDGERQGVIARITKVLDNGWEAIFKLGNNVDAIGKLLKAYNTEKLKTVLAELKSGARKQATDYVPENVAVSKKLAIYYSMGNDKFDVSKVIEHINMPYELIVEKKLFTDGCNGVVKSILVSRGNEDTVKEFKPSIDVLDKFTLPEVRKWLSKDTKAGLVSNFIGNKFSITSVMQDRKGTGVRNDHYTVPTTAYVKKATPMLAQADAVKLLQAGIDLGPKGAKIAEVGKNEFWKKSKEQIAATVTSAGWLWAGNIFSLPRQVRLVNLTNNWVASVAGALLHLKKSHIESGEMIYQIVDKMYPKA